MSLSSDGKIHVGDTIRFKCSGCAKFFSWVVPENWIYCIPSFHSDSCKDRNRRRMRNAEVVQKCPHPYKKGYSHKPWAEEEARRQAENKQELYREYRCPCGSFHVGHRGFSVTKRAKVLEPA